MIVRRLPGGPLVRPGMDERMGDNINGPSVIRVPDWVPDALGRYYLYFGHHQGSYIRLACADRIEGPWRVHARGVLELEASWFSGHIASPDVHVDDAARQIRMYYHGVLPEGPVHQATRVATSPDGLLFTARPELLGAPYWRGFRWRDHWYGLAMPGLLYRSTDPLGGYEEGPRLFGPEMRHSAVHVDGDHADVYYTLVGDAPERILASRIELAGDWHEWRPTPPVEVLRPRTPAEGADLTVEPSVRGAVHRPVNQLRDPYLFLDGGRRWLFYAVAGERGIAVAEVVSGP